MTGMRAQGFTLLELLITVAIAVILLTLGVPSFLEMADKNRISGAAESIYGELQFARSLSIELNRDVGVVFTRTSASNWCYGVATDNDGNGAVDGDDCNCTTALACLIDIDPGDGLDTSDPTDYTERVTQSSDFSGVTLTNPNASVSGVTFEALRTTANGNTFEVTSGKGKAIRVITAPMGRVTSCSPAGTTFVTGYTAC